MKTLKNLFVLLLLTSSGNLFAQNVVSLSLFNPVQTSHESESVGGVRINLIYGVNEYMAGLDGGLANVVNKDFAGAQFGLVNRVGGDFAGYQEGVVNIVEGQFTGFQSGLVNYNEGNFIGFQLSFFNKAKTVTGLQLGLINIAYQLDDGLQIGLINIVDHGKAFPFMPIVNWSF